MKNLLPPLVGAMAVLLLALAAFLIRQNGAIDEFQRQVSAERAAFDQRAAELKLVIQERERELRDTRDKVAQLQRELSVARAAAGLETDRERSLTDPAALEFRRRQQRRMVQERYGDLFDRLALAPEALEEFKRLLIELEDPPLPAVSAAENKAAGNAAAGEPSRTETTRR